MKSQHTTTPCPSPDINNIRDTNLYESTANNIADASLNNNSSQCCPHQSNDKTHQKTRVGKKKKVHQWINLPEEIVKWIDDNFPNIKDKNTAYKYAYAAHLQVGKIVLRKNYGYICLPKTMLEKYITNKNIRYIKKAFASAKLVYHKGWKKSINDKWMAKYSFDQEMFLSRLVKVSVYSFIVQPNQLPSCSNPCFPLSYERGA